MKLYLLGLVPLFCILSGAFADGNVTIPDLPDVPKKANFYANSSGTICVMFDAGVRFSFNYINSTDVNKTQEFDLINDVFNKSTATAEGTCGTGNQLKIEFYEDHEWVLTLDFKNVSTNKTWELSGMTLDYVLTPGKLPLPDVKANSSGHLTVDVGPGVFNTKQNRSYQCESRQMFALLDNVANITTNVANITIRNMQVEAFRKKDDTSFNNPTSCPEDSVSNIVPIAVGAALGALVLIVLIAYLIGRRKSRQGYESV